MRRLVVVVALMLACGSCGGVRTGPVDGSGSERDEQQPSQAELTIDDIDARQAAWERSKPDAYRYVIESTCGCDWGGTFEVTVTFDEVASVRSTDPGDAERYRRHFGQSVEEMFAMFREALTVGAEEGAGSRVTAAFDESLGYPRSFAVHWTRNGEPYDATVTGFVAIDPSDVPASDMGTVALVISNQSFEHPDARIAVAIDGETVADGSFAVEGQHSYTSYDVHLMPGLHELQARSDVGARLSTSIDVEAEAPLFLVLTHWTSDEPGQEPAYFDLTASSEPPGFG